MVRTPAVAVAMIAVVATAVLAPVCAVAGLLWVGPLGDSTLIQLDRSVSEVVASARTARVIDGAGQPGP